MTDTDDIQRPVRPPTPIWVPRAAIWFVGTFAAFVAAGWLLFQLRALVSLLAIALFASFALEPAVAAFSRKGMRRGVAAGLVMLTAAVVLIALAGSIGALAVAQGATLANDLPGIVKDLVTFTNETADTKFNPTEMSAKVQAWADNFSVDAVGAGTIALGIVGQLLTIVFFAFYFAADGPRLRRMVVSMVRQSHQGEVLRVFELAIAKTGGYMYSRGLMALLSAAAHALAFYLMDVPYPIPLALWIGITSHVVPVVGTYIGAAVPVLVALNVSPGTAIAAVAENVRERITHAAKAMAGIELEAVRVHVVGVAKPSVGVKKKGSRGA